MRNGIPVVQIVYRAVWVALHLALVASALMAAVLWLTHDGTGVGLVTDAWRRLEVLQQEVARAIPFPWGG